MLSADFLQFVVTMPCRTPVRPPEVRHKSFLFNLPDLPHGVTLIFWILACLVALSVRTALVSGFCSSGQDFVSPCFQLIPHDTHLGVHYAVGYEYLRCGLPPLRLVPCSAHKKKKPFSLLFCVHFE
jgi:hypothetical protein